MFKINRISILIISLCSNVMKPNGCVFQNLLFRQSHKLFQLHYTKNLRLENQLQKIAEIVKDVRLSGNLSKLIHTRKKWTKTEIIQFAAYMAYHYPEKTSCQHSSYSSYWESFHSLYAQAILPFLNVLWNPRKSRQIIY